MHPLCVSQHAFTILISDRLPMLEHLIERLGAETLWNHVIFPSFYGK